MFIVEDNVQILSLVHKKSTSYYCNSVPQHYLNNTNLRKHLCCNIDVLQAHSDSYSSSYTAAYFFFSPSIASLAAVALAIFMFGPFPLYSPQSTFRMHWILPSSRVFAFLKKTKQNKKKHENLRDQEPIV